MINISFLGSAAASIPLAPAIIWNLLVNSSQGLGTNAGTTSGLNTTGANLLIVGVMYYAPDGTVSLSDSHSNSWTGLSAYENSPIPGNAGAARLFYCYNPTVGTGHTFTVSGSSSYASISVLGFSGAVASPYDGSNGNGGSGSYSSTQPGSITPTTNGDLIVTFAGYSASTAQTLSISSPFTLASQVAAISSSNYYSIGIAYAYQTTAAAINPTWTCSTSVANFATTIAAFKS